MENKEVKELQEIYSELKEVWANNIWIPENWLNRFHAYLLEKKKENEKKKP